MPRTRTAHRALVLTIVLPVALLVGACGSEDGATGDALTSTDRRSADPSDSGAVSSSTAPTAGDPAAAELVRTAATRSAEQAWARISVAIEADGEVVAATDGVGDFANTTFDGTTTVPGVGQVGYLVVDGVAYVQTPNLPNGATWIAISIEELGAQMGMDIGAQQAFGLLQAAGDVVEVGSEELDGVATTKYELRTTAEEMMAQATASGVFDEDAIDATSMFRGEVRMDIWVDGEGLLRRLVYSLPIAPGTPGLPFDELTYRFGMSDYGVSVDVVAPPPETVISMADAMAVPN